RHEFIAGGFIARGNGYIRLRPFTDEVEAASIAFTRTTRTTRTAGPRARRAITATRTPMIIDTSCYPTNLVDLAWRHDGEPFSGERLLQMMDGPYTVCGKPRRIDKAFIQPPQGNTIYTDGVMDLAGR